MYILLASFSDCLVGGKKKKSWYTPFTMHQVTIVSQKSAHGWSTLQVCQKEWGVGRVNHERVSCVVFYTVPSKQTNHNVWPSQVLITHNTLNGNMSQCAQCSTTTFATFVYTNQSCNNPLWNLLQSFLPHMCMLEVVLIKFHACTLLVTQSVLRG